MKKTITILETINLELAYNNFSFFLKGQSHEIFGNR
jgi:hypothetical protein